MKTSTLEKNNLEKGKITNLVTIDISSLASFLTYATYIF